MKCSHKKNQLKSKATPELSRKSKRFTPHSTPSRYVWNYSTVNDPAAIQSKAIEICFGNMDREIKKSGPQGFDKCTSDLIIKYSKDLILVGDEEKWRTTANRAASKSLSITKKEFDKKPNKS